MIVLDKEPCKISINTHGGVVLHFEGFCIWNTISKQWGVTFENGDMLNKFFDFILDAYQASIKHSD